MSYAKYEEDNRMISEDRDYMRYAACHRQVPASKNRWAAAPMTARKKEKAETSAVPAPREEKEVKPKKKKRGKGKKIVCRDCGQTFLFGKGEQKYFAERGWTDPVRCIPCRRARREQREMMKENAEVKEQTEETK